MSRTLWTPIASPIWIGSIQASGSASKVGAGCPGEEFVRTVALEGPRAPAAARVRKPWPLVLRDLGALHRHIARGLDVDVTAAIERNVVTLDGDCTVLLEGDARRARLQDDLVAGFDCQLLADR